MAQLPILNSFPMLAVSPPACSSRSLAAPALPPPAPPSRRRRGKIPPTPSALSAACSKRKSLRTKTGKQGGLKSVDRSWRAANCKLQTANCKLQTASSFVAESHHRIDARGPSSRHIARQQSSAADHPRNQCINPRSAHAKLLQQALEHSRQGHRQRHSDRRSGHRQFHPFTDDLPQNLYPIGSQRHANPNLLCAEPHGVRHQSVQPHSGKCERQRRKNPEHLDEQALSRDLISNPFLETHHTGNRLVLIHSPNHFAKSRRESIRISSRPHHQGHFCCAPLQKSFINFRIVRGLQGPSLHIPDDTDDFAPLVSSLTRGVDQHLLADRVSFWKELPRKHFAHDSDCVRIQAIRFREGSPANQPDFGGFEKLGAHHKISRFESFSRRKILLSFLAERNLIRASGRQCGSQRCQLRSWQVFHPCEQLPVEGSLFLGAGIRGICE